MTDRVKRAGHPKEGLGNKPDASKLKFMRTSKGHVKGTLTIPVIATDTVSDLKRKLKRTLAPLVERNVSVGPTANQQPFGDTMLRTPGKSPMRTPPRSRFSSNEGHQGSEEWRNAELRKISSESKNGGGRSLSFSKLMSLSPNPKPVFQSPQHCPAQAPYSPGGPKSGPLPSKKPLEDITEAKPAPATAKRLTFTSKSDIPPNSVAAPDRLVRPTSVTAKKRALPWISVYVLILSCDPGGKLGDGVVNAGVLIWSLEQV